MSIGERWPDYGKPATKGDVIGAMIWTQALVVRASLVALAASGTDKTAVAEEYEAFLEEVKDFDRKMDRIGGGRNDGDQS